jgi:hypothetical protein
MRREILDFNPILRIGQTMHLPDPEAVFCWPWQPPCWFAAREGGDLAACGRSRDRSQAGPATRIRQNSLRIFDARPYLPDLAGAEIGADWVPSSTDCEAPLL